MTGVSSLKSVMMTVTVAVLLFPRMSVACTVNLYSSIVSRSSTLASKTMRLSVLLRKPNMSSMERGPGLLRAEPMATVISAGKKRRSKKKKKMIIIISKQEKKTRTHIVTSRILTWFISDVECTNLVTTHGILRERKGVLCLLKTWRIVYHSSHNVDNDQCSHTASGIPDCHLCMVRWNETNNS